MSEPNDLANIQDSRLEEAIQAIQVLTGAASIAEPAFAAVGATVTAALNLITGEARNRRIGVVISSLIEQLKELRDNPLSEEYRKSDEFKILMTTAFQRCQFEASEEKLYLYAAFLAGAIEAPGDASHAERRRFLRIIEQMEWEHVRVLAAYRDGETSVGGVSTSVIKVLNERVGSDMTEDDIQEAVNALLAWVEDSWDSRNVCAKKTSEHPK